MITTKIDSRKRRSLLRGLAALSMAPAIAGKSSRASEPYPSRALRIVVPYPPGAINDVLARAIGERLTASMGKAVIVENKPGGNTLIGTQFVAKSDPDGYTLLQVPAAHAINAALQRRLPYDPIKDFSFITLAARAPFLLVVSKASPINSVQDLVAAAKKAPDAISFASSGTGGNAHLMGELLNNVADIQMLHVPYKGTAAAINDIIGGQVQCTFSTYSGAAAAIQADRLKVLAVTSAKRAPVFPDIPTIAESGYPSYDVVGWWGFAVAAGTATAIVDRLHNEIIQACNTPALKERLAADAVEIVGSTPEEFVAYLNKDIALWRDLGQRARITWE
ncbi:tripartite tricarboxylate transporter substrate binding protein [Bordetella genomosp. 4]|uniref:LacI family transcriptional regulator n=1 Tax=Bordetella genomosp. 4 TaxID=463044 RepID=A0A261UV08_9BORD|nr:tripartite tricarboxylate transporter substrate binding protein [Bordetella genomosp. 4]OZI64733.1 hypothetical protein CAL20_03550 [Bordetella genomosp. 4]